MNLLSQPTKSRFSTTARISAKREWHIQTSYIAELALTKLKV